MKTGIILTVAGVIYFLPTIIAWARRLNSEAAIFVVNLLASVTLIWLPAVATVLFWLFALVWSLTGNTEGAILITPTALQPRCRNGSAWALYPR